MKKIILLALPIILVFNMFTLSFASDDDDHGDDFNPYEWLASQGYLPSSDEDFASVYNDTVRKHVGEGQHSKYQRHYDDYLNNRIDFNTYVDSVNDDLISDNVNIDDFFNSLLSTVSSYENYFTVPTFPASRFGRAYQENQNGLNFMTNVINNQKLTLVWSNSDWGFDNYLGGASRNVSDQVFINTQNTNPQDIYNVYNSYYRFTSSAVSGSRSIYVANICDDNGDNISVSLPPNAPGQSSVVYEYGSYCKMLIYSDQNYSLIPVFRSKESYYNFMSGNISFYTLDYLKQLNLQELQNIDYKKLQATINNSIANGDWLTANELQAIINGSLLGYLEEMGLDIKDILLKLQLGLFDPNGVPYLKLIDDKLTIIVNNLGTGSSYNDLELQLKLDMIIGLLGMPDIDLDVDTPELNDLKLTSLSKFPFCIPEDLYIIVSLIGVEPEKPDLFIDFPIMGQEDTIQFQIDLSWFDAFRPYWYTFCDIGYLIFLIMMSLKIIEGVKD